jgi:hypothetical protein
MTAIETFQWIEWIALEETEKRVNNANKLKSPPIILTTHSESWTRI